MKHITILLALLMTVSSPVSAQDFDKGFAAAQAGDYATALQEWTPLAEQGDAHAQYNLGVMYSDGQGVIQDYKEAVKWYKLAAEQGFANAQYNLAKMYENGKGAPQDYAEAVKWWRLAAEQGFADAQYNLGNMYRQGQGVPVGVPVGSDAAGSVLAVHKRAEDRARGANVAHGRHGGNNASHVCRDEAQALKTR